MIRRSTSHPRIGEPRNLSTTEDGTVACRWRCDRRPLRAGSSSACDRAGRREGYRPVVRLELPSRSRRVRLGAQPMATGMDERPGWCEAKVSLRRPWAHGGMALRHGTAPNLVAESRLAARPFPLLSRGSQVRDLPGAPTFANHSRRSWLRLASPSDERTCDPRGTPRVALLGRGGGAPRGAIDVRDLPGAPTFANHSRRSWLRLASQSSHRTSQSQAVATRQKPSISAWHPAWHPFRGCSGGVGMAAGMADEGRCDLALRNRSAAGYVWSAESRSGPRVLVRRPRAERSGGARGWSGATVAVGGDYVERQQRCLSEARTGVAGDEFKFRFLACCPHDADGQWTEVVRE